MSPISGNNLALRWRTFTAAPHRVMFFGGALQAVAAMLWWLADLVLRYVAGHPPQWPVASVAMHVYLLIYGMFPFFMFGFLLTVFPRWMAGREIPARHYVPAFVLLMSGSVFFYLGLSGSRVLLIISVMLGLCGWAVACHALLRVLLDTSRQDKRHPVVALLALTLGWCGMAAYLAWLLSDQGAWLDFAIQAGIWFFLLPVFVTVGHRMIPFFTSSALPRCRVMRADWPWHVILACSLGHGLLQLSGMPSWLWLCDAPLAIAALYLSYAWNLRRSLAVPMLALLHIGFVWLGIAALLLTAQSLALLASHGEYMPLGLAPLHALTIGFFASLLFGMSTRVTIGHSGLPFGIGRAEWFMFAALQTAVLLRILADILPAGLRAWLYPLAAIGWLACFLPWVFAYLPAFLKPRADRRPG